jgi:hypothetical protein
VEIGAGFAYRHGERPKGKSEGGAKIMKSKKAKVSKLHKGKKLEEQKPLKDISFTRPINKPSH